ncbi:hypothetical protein AA700_0303 [Acidiphilium acidophilum DSM 700]|nr:hypothetical protein AA700_0303 [Acidiphilium acidophilum DSM 700]
MLISTGLGQASEGEEPIAGFFEAVGQAAAFQTPFGEEQPAPAHHLGTGFGVDHVVVVGGDLLVQGVWRMGQQISMLVHGAALRRRVWPKPGQRTFEAGAAIDQQQFRGAQAPRDEIIEHGAPGGFAFASHVLHRQQQLLPIAADTKHDQQ